MATALLVAAAGAIALASAVTVIALVVRESRRRQDVPKLEGRYVLVNTPKPDDQSFRGWVRRQYPNGALELGDAELLELAPGGVVAQPSGTVLIQRHSWIGLDAVPPAD